MHLRSIGRHFTQMNAYFLVMNSKRCKLLGGNKRGALVDPGETAKIFLESYENRPDWSTTSSEDVIESLTAIEQHLFKRYVTFPLLCP